MPCWYCGTPLTRRRGPQQRTIEHLVAVADGGTDDPRNLRQACADCNITVDRWPADVKVRFRALATEMGWDGMRGRFGKRRGARARILAHLLSMPLPSDRASQEALAYAAEMRGSRRGSAPAMFARRPPGRVTIDLREFVATAGRMPRRRLRNPWRFEIAGEPWAAPDGASYGVAIVQAIARAAGLGVAVVRVLP